MKHRIVEFQSGEFAIRVRRKTYLDLVSTQFSWRIGDEHFNDCLGTLDQCLDVFKRSDYRIKRFVKL